MQSLGYQLRDGLEVDRNYNELFYLSMSVLGNVEPLLHKRCEGFIESEILEQVNFFEDIKTSVHTNCNNHK